MTQDDQTNQQNQDQAQDQVTSTNDNADDVVVNADVTADTPVVVQEDRTKWFRVGDTVVVNYKIVEGEKFRIQAFEGIVIGVKGMGQSKTFTVRRIAAGSIGVERIFPLFSPSIESVKVKHKGAVRRAKLYYLRDRVGKAANKIKERV